MLLALFYHAAAEGWNPHVSIAGDHQAPFSKFSERTALAIENVIFGSDGTGVSQNPSCPVPLELVWTNQLEGGVYATPAIEQLLVDGTRQVIIPAFERDLSIVDSDGHHLAGWPVPVKEGAYFHSSPLLIDFDGDGVRDIIWVSVDAEIFVINGSPGMFAALLHPSMHIPRLRMPKLWHGNRSRGETQAQKQTPAQPQAQMPASRRLLQVNLQADGVEAGLDQLTDGLSPEARDSWDVFNEVPVPFAGDGVEGNNGNNNNNGVDVNGGDFVPFGVAPVGDEGEADPGYAPVGADRYEEIAGEDTEGNLQYFEENEVPSWKDDEVPPVQPDGFPLETEHVWVDAHVLTSPAAADVNGDGFMDLIIPVSHYFDEDEFRNHPENFKRLPVDAHTRDYIACAVVAMDLVQREVIWSQLLDVTTDYTKVRAFAYSSPTIVDLEGDGNLEIILGTSVGHIYVLDAATGKVRPNFPLVMGEVQAQVAVEDLNGDGILEMVVGDSKGNVICFNAQGRELWEKQLSGFVAQNAVFGDINGDGVLDVVIATLSGGVWALRGDNGETLPHFPFKTDDRILAPVLLVNLDESATEIQVVRLDGHELQDTGTYVAPQDGIKRVRRQNGLHLVFPSFDGHLYIVDGRTGCSNRIDIGEQSYGMVLADDLLGNGYTDLVLVTMAGTVMCFSTNSPHQPLKSWHSHSHGRNGFTALERYHGMHATATSRQDREILGEEFSVEFVIIDNRAAGKRESGRYDIKIYFGALSAAELTGWVPLAADSVPSPASPRPPSSHKNRPSVHKPNAPIFNATYSRPGTYKVRLRSPVRPVRALVHIEMLNEHNQLFTDSYVLSFNTHYYRIFKWLLLGPLAVIALIVYLTLPNNQHAHKQLQE